MKHAYREDNSKNLATGDNQDVFHGKKKMACNNRTTWCCGQSHQEKMRHGLISVRMEEAY